MPRPDPLPTTLPIGTIIEYIGKQFEAQEPLIRDGSINFFI